MLYVCFLFTCVYLFLTLGFNLLHCSEMTFICLYKHLSFSIFPTVLHLHLRSLLSLSTSQDIFSKLEQSNHHKTNVLRQFIQNVSNGTWQKTTPVWKWKSITILLVISYKNCYLFFHWEYSGNWFSVVNLFSDSNTTIKMDISILIFCKKNIKYYWTPSVMQLRVDKKFLSI